ncbi:MarR family winged helix-turn-helix transcriptional regulator [Ottowia thiooxydans]|uniref:MarR family winged helix-turn-helix transcriptional regulator n=1 Tax=Ottowia thiooxydans TaxID=219182 RepID=UPI0004270BEC|nr:MarR family transcriptional regulator [Ottowia thiooxydans]
MQQGSFAFEQAPGHLIRRAHQISVATFAEETSAFGVTPIQFAILNALMHAPGVDQITLAGRVAFDAATIGSVIARLEKKGWLRRQAADLDRRRKLLWLTPTGENAVASMQADVVRVQERILSPLNDSEQLELMALLKKLVASNDRETAPHGSI